MTTRAGVDVPPSATHPVEGISDTPALLSRPMPAVPPALLRLLGLVDVELCHQVSACGHYFFKGSCGCGKRAIPRTCKARFCPDCERRRAISAVDRYGPLFDGQRYVRHLVLTAKRVPLGELAEGMRRLRKSFRKLRAKLGRCFVGGVYSMEIKGKAATRDSAGGWHPHIHALIYGDHLPKKHLDELWPEVTDGRGSITWISAVKTPEVDNMRRGLKEALKYAVKGAAGEIDGEHFVAGWTPAMLREALDAMKHARLFQKLGESHGQKIAQLEPCVCETCEQPVVVEVGGTLMNFDQARDWLEGWYTPHSAQLNCVWDGTAGRFRPCAST